MSKLLAQPWALPAFSILAAAVFLAVHFSSNNWKEDPEITRGGDFDQGGGSSAEEEPPELSDGGFLTDEWLRPFTYVPTSTPNEGGNFVPIPTTINSYHNIPPPVEDHWQWNPSVYGAGQPTPDPALLLDPNLPPNLKVDNNQWQWNIDFGEPTPDPAQLTNPATPPSLKTNDGSPVVIKWAIPFGEPTPDPATLYSPETPPYLVTNENSPVVLKWNIPFGEPTPDPVEFQNPATPPAIVTTNDSSPVVLKWNIPFGEPTPDPQQLYSPATPPEMILTPNQQAPIQINWNLEFFESGQPTPDPAVLLQPATPPEWKTYPGSPVIITFPLPSPNEQPSRPLEYVTPQPVAPTDSPTITPTTNSPTTNSPTTNSPTQAPVTLSPTEPGETRSPTKTPTPPPTNNPTRTPTDSPTQAPVTLSPTRPGETRAPLAPYGFVMPIPTDAPTPAPVTLSPTRPGETRAPLAPYSFQLTPEPTPPPPTLPPVLATPTPTPKRPLELGKTPEPTVPPTPQPLTPNPTNPPVNPPPQEPAPQPQPVNPPPQEPAPQPQPVNPPPQEPAPQPQPVNPPPQPQPVNPPPFNPPPFNNPAPFNPPPFNPPAPFNPPPYNNPAPFNPPPYNYPAPFNPPPYNYPAPFNPPPFNPPAPTQPRPYRPPQPTQPRPYQPPTPIVWRPSPPGVVIGPGGPGGGVVIGVPPAPTVYVPPRAPPLHNEIFLEGCDPRRCTLNEEAEFHSMSNEDEAIFELFYTNPIKCCRVVIEIGAGDGEQYSFSRYFEEALNWRPLLIEANPVHYEELKLNREEAATQNGAFCESTHLEFYSETNTFSSLGGDIEISSELHSPPKTGTPKVEVPCLRMRDVFTKWGITKVDVMVIRLQGDALAFIRSMDWTVRVDIWVVLMHGGTDTARNFLVGQVLQRNEYHMAWWDIRRWCVQNGLCLNNQVFLRKGVNPLPCEDLYQHQLVGNGQMARRLEGGGGTMPKGLPGHLRQRP